MSVFGTHLVVSLFGESHGPFVGVSAHHLPADIPIDIESVAAALSRRRPLGPAASERRERDRFDIVSGLYEGRTTGAPLTILIPNEDIDRRDYDPFIPRPGHADIAAAKKYKGANDPYGGGHFSGRLSAPLVALGDIVRQILAPKGIAVFTHIRSVGDVRGPSITSYGHDLPKLNALESSAFPALEDTWRARLESAILAAKAQGDSVGGETETLILGCEAGLGEPFFDSVESVLSHLLFSIPGVKGVAFGKGFSLAGMLGSEANDPIRFDASGKIRFTKNDMGGILGGISSGQPILFSTAFKPTPTISKPQETVHLGKRKNIIHTFSGRHDPCIAVRASHVVTALTYIAILELTLRNGGYRWKLSKN